MYQKAHALLTVAGGSASNTVKVAGVSLDKKTMGVKTKGTNTVKAIVVPDGASNKDVAWTVEPSDNSIATVKADADKSVGVVTGVKAGNATVTATTSDGSKKASVKVTVTD